ncbi:hypothetical protein, partial [Rahnella bonaserana]|uniref:hypothetical protein n=1 Tax=Rahnella bonaserana TaxID=2816248 RepID=UPI003208D190
LGAKIASVTSGHNVTCFDYEVMISPLFRWPDLVFHFNPTEKESASLPYSFPHKLFDTVFLTKMVIA